MIQSLSLCARIALALHNLNSEGTEGNQQQTRMVYVVDAEGKRIPSTLFPGTCSSTFTCVI
jgi:hypothetical protein